MVGQREAGTLGEVFCSGLELRGGAKWLRSGEGRLLDRAQMRARYRGGSDRAWLGWAREVRPGRGGQEGLIPRRSIYSSNRSVTVLHPLRINC